MANLQYKNQNIRYGNYNFYSFSAKKREYEFNNLLEAIAQVQPELKKEIEKFNHKYTVEFCDKFLAHKVVPIGPAQPGEVVELNNITSTVETFFAFKDYLKDLQKELKTIVGKLSKYQDSSQFSTTYKEGLFYQKNYRSVRQIDVYKDKQIIENKEISKQEEDILKDNHYGYLNLKHMVMLGYMNIYDLVDMAKKDPFAKLLNSELYQSSEEDFNFEVEPEIELPDMTLYYLGTELPNASPSFHWLSVRGAGNAVYIDYYTDIEMATPLNAQRLKEVISSNNKQYVCLEYKAQFSKTHLTKNALTEKINVSQEKKKIMSEVNTQTEMPKKKTLKL